jgi:uncharacterized protein YggT (Ycf19 family)
MPEDSLLGAYWPYYLPTYIILTAMAYLVARAILSVFIRPGSPNIVWRIVVLATEPILRVTRWITPPFMIEALQPLAAAGWLLLIWLLFRELMAAQGLVPEVQVPAG